MKRNQIALCLYVGGATVIALNLAGIVSTTAAWCGFAIQGVAAALAYQSPARKGEANAQRQGRV